jgi:hypothetical protein
VDPMEARVARLEDDMREIKTDLKALREEVRSGFYRVAVDLAEVKGRMSHLPTVWQINLQMIGLIFTVLGGAFVILRYTGH